MRSLLHKCAVLAAATLVIVAIVGPLCASLVLSCVSTRTCDVDDVLSLKDAHCAEGEGERSRTLLHGDVCTVTCSNGRVPTTPELRCDDGTVNGAITLECIKAPEDYGPTDGGLVEGAVTDGPLWSVCDRAQNLGCGAARGGTSMLVLLVGLTRSECTDLLAECKELNEEFDWGQFDSGTCTLGCFAEILPEVELAQERAEQASLGDSIFAAVAAAPIPDQGFCNSGPSCLSISGACNAGDNGDYFKYPVCASSYTQWAMADESRRLRYDGNSVTSQSGKWVLESGVNIGSEEPGFELARQPSFATGPAFDTRLWNSHCAVSANNGFGVQYTAQQVVVTVSRCSCTDAGDCSGHGKAIGSKDNGPYCFCECNTGYTGSHCQIQQCVAPEVINSQIPSCAEGIAVDEGSTCTPACRGGYRPSRQSLTCGAGGQFVEPVFECVEDPALDYLQGSSDDASRPPCTADDCNGHGQPLGVRLSDGTCVCTCDEGYSGPECGVYGGNCLAPAPGSIPNAHLTKPCEEGSIVGTECTAQCLDSYYPLPATLACTANGLVPATFNCYGGPTVQDTWCLAMKYMAISLSIVVTVALCTGIVCYKTSGGRLIHTFVVGKHLVQVEADHHGHFNVVRTEGVEKKPKWESSGSRGSLPRLGSTGESFYPQKVLALEDSAFESKSPGSTAWTGPSPASTGFSFRSLRTVASERGTPAALGNIPNVQTPTDRPAILDSSAGMLLASPPHSPVYSHGMLVEYDLTKDGVEAEAPTWRTPSPSPGGTLRGTLPMAHPHGQDEQQQNAAWLARLHGLEGQVEVREADCAATLRPEQRRRSHAEVDAIVLATGAERAALEEVLRSAIAANEKGALSAAIAQAKAAQPLHLAKLIAEAELLVEHLDADAERAQQLRRHQEQMKQGQILASRMTQQQLWRHVETCSVEGVRAGLRAKLPLHGRSSDGHMRTLMHVACHGICTDGSDAALAAKRLCIIKLLLEAKASANVTDARGRTPLDYALEKGDTGAAGMPAVKAIQMLGLRTTHYVTT